MSAQPEVIVVGAGISGVMIALNLRRRGCDVTLIDKWEPGHSRASSTDYNRVIRSIHGHDEFYTKWARDARIGWLELEHETGQKLFYECGTLILATQGHCHWEDATEQTFGKLGVPYRRMSSEDIRLHFPMFKADDIAYGLYEPEAGMIMAHRAVITALNLFKSLGGTVKRGNVVTDANERLMLDGKPLEADTIVVATGPWMSEMYPRTVKPITHVVGINVFYTSTPEGSTEFDAERMPCWIDHGQSAFGLPSVEGHGVKAAAVIPEHIDINDDDRLIDKNLIPRTQSYIRTRFPGLVGQKVVDSKFNQIIMTPDTHFILDWHPDHENVLLAGGCSGHLFKHGPVWGEFAGGVAVKDYGTAERFKLAGRRKLSPAESPSGR
ncbi:MAG: FAD-dependent oxidoreductase [Sedimentitalea sp.]